MYSIYWGVERPEKDILNKSCYCFVDIESQEKIKKSVEHLFNYPNHYLCETIFIKDSEKIVKKYYDDIINEIKTILNI